MVGLSQSAISRIERGFGGGSTLDALQRLALALGSPLRIGLARDSLEGTADAGHLAIQELALRLGRTAGYEGSFELATRPTEPWRSADVGLAMASKRRLLHVECWNTVGDVGAAVRSSARKRAELEAMGVARWGAGASTALVWVVRASARNRALVARYPEVFRRAFPGSSRQWLAALTEGSDPPSDPGLVWSDIAGTRLFAWRRPT